MGTIGEDTRDFGRTLMRRPEVKGLKLVVFLNDGRVTEYNNLLDPLFDKEEKRR